MAGQRRRGSRDRERSSRRVSPVALAAAASVAGPGTEAITPTVNQPQATTPSTARTPTPRAVSRLLEMKGMNPDEAASLTAFMYGLPTADLRWTIPQLNQLLFFRDLRQTGRFGRED